MESQCGQESAADKRLSSQDSTNAQSVDSLLGTKVYGKLIAFKIEVPMSYFQCLICKTSTTIINSSDYGKYLKLRPLIYMIFLFPYLV